MSVQENNEKQNLALAELSAYGELLLLGEGGTSVVYRGSDRLLERKVAIKMLRVSALNDDVLRRFQIEAKSLASLKHPNIVEIYKLGLLSSGNPYLVMEYLEGDTLRNCLQKNSNLPGAEFILIFVSVLKALVYAHDRKIIHRDIKPENIILLNFKNTADKQNSSDAPAVKLLDFGIAKILSESNGVELRGTQTGAILGSPKYMSPEQCGKSAVDYRADIYSLACVMYECLVGEPLFDGSTAVEIMYKHLNESTSAAMNATAARGLSKPMIEYLSKALARNPDERYQSAAEMLAQLELIKETEISPVNAASAGKKRLNAGYLVLTVAFVLLIILICNPFFKKTSSPSISNADSNSSAAESSVRARTLFDAVMKRFGGEPFPETIAKLEKVKLLAVKQKDKEIECRAAFEIGEVEEKKTGKDASPTEAAAAFAEALRLCHKNLNPNDDLISRSEIKEAKQLKKLNRLEEAAKLLQIETVEKFLSIVAIFLTRESNWR